MRLRCMKGVRSKEENFQAIEERWYVEEENQEMGNSPHGSVTSEGPSGWREGGGMQKEPRRVSLSLSHQEIPNFPQQESEVSLCIELSEGWAPN